MRDEIEFALAVPALKGLIARWRFVEEKRREFANKARGHGQQDIAVIMCAEARADVYRRLAAELEAAGRDACVPNVGEQFVEAEQIEKEKEN